MSRSAHSLSPEHVDPPQGHQHCDQDSHRSPAGEEARPDRAPPTGRVIDLRRGQGPSTTTRAVHLSRLSMRWLLEQEARKGEVTRSTLERISGYWARSDMPRPRIAWPDVPSSVAQSIAIRRMQETEPIEAEKYEEFQRQSRLMLSKIRGSTRAKKQAEQEVMRRRAVFLSRFFPVPRPGEWSPSFWTPEEFRLVATTLAKHLGTIERPVEPAWWPDDWRESLEEVQRA